MLLTPDNVTPALMICNEDNWIFYVLRDLYEVFPQILVLDTGSDDRTKEIIKTCYPNVNLLEECYGHDAHKIGNGRNVLREACQTHWMLLSDGDEVYRKNDLLRLLQQQIEDHIKIVMITLSNVEDVNGKLMYRTHDYQNKDFLFSPEIRWSKTDYPFEGYRLHEDYIDTGRAYYVPKDVLCGWHMRHTVRSSRNDAAFYRNHKYNFFPYQGPWSELPEDWLGEINLDFPNPYLIPTQVRQS
jgi:glycosyltransferase involved in cell wall biosynthesis